MDKNTIMNKSVGIQDFYYRYRKINPVTYKLYMSITQGFAKFIVEKLKEGEVIRLPERLGLLYFTGKKLKPRLDKETNYIKGLSPDWGATRELWEKSEEMRERKELVFCFNEHTNGIRYRMKWSKSRVLIDNKDFYNFTLARDVKREFAKLLKEGKEYLTDN